MGKTTPKTRSETCKAEMTRDVIFLFQVKEYRLGQVIEHECHGYEYCSDCQNVYKDGHWIVTHELDHPDFEGLSDAEISRHDTYKKYETPIPWKELCQEGFAHSWWRTDSVWLHQEEAEAYGESRSYNWKYGWRVYGQVSEGELKTLLKFADHYKTQIDLIVRLGEYTKNAALSCLKLLSSFTKIMEVAPGLKCLLSHTGEQMKKASDLCLQHLDKLKEGGLLDE